MAVLQRERGVQFIEAIFVLHSLRQLFCRKSFLLIRRTRWSERERERISVAQCSWNANTELEQSITILLQKGTFFLSLERASKKDNVVVFLLISQSENISVRLKQFVLRDQLNTNFI